MLNRELIIKLVIAELKKNKELREELKEILEIKK